MSLPNTGKLNIIKSINLEQLSLVFTEAMAYNPMTGSNLTTAAFTLSFTFPVDITMPAQNITTWYDGQSFAELVIPWGPSMTDVLSNIPFAVYPDQHVTFQNFVAATMLGSSQTLALAGTANADASMAVGCCL